MLRRGNRVGRYLIEGLLGQGGMGQVHVALDEQLRRRVALKTVQRVGELAPDAATYQRLIREARAAAVLNHPNAIAVYDIGEQDDVTYIAMELVRGRTLKAYLPAPRVTIPTKIRWILDVARVLADAHRLNLIHRDVKPSNVMIRDDGIVKVLDFGVVKRLKKSDEPSADRSHDLTADGVILGTPRYMAPEAFEGIVGPATDQFAWGLVSYELLTGVHPFVAPPDVPQYEWLLQCTPLALQERVQGIPEPVVATVMRAISKDPAARFRSMARIADVLDDFDGPVATS
jgi:eukaryotic-like serine/threonine-protein kinase